MDLRQRLGASCLSRSAACRSDPGDEDEEVSSWGGLTGFGSRFAEVVRQATNGQVLQRENSFFRGLKFRLTGIGGKKL